MSMGNTIKWLQDQDLQINSVIDVGASDGRWSRMCQKHFPASKYYLFEPQDVHQEKLANFTSSHKNVTVFPEAVGARDGVTFFDATDAFGGALADELGNGIVEVPMTTIDSAMSRSDSSGPYLLKLDTHGYEPGIIEGALSTIASASALIIECYAHNIAPGSLRFYQLCVLLEGHGFRPARIADPLNRSSDGSLWQLDIVFLRDSWQGFATSTYS